MPEQTLWEFAEGTNHIEPIWMKENEPTYWEQSAPWFDVEFFPETGNMIHNYYDMAGVKTPAYYCTYEISQSNSWQIGYPMTNYVKSTDGSCDFKKD